MNHKRRRPKHQRAGCLLCKPHKDERGSVVPADKPSVRRRLQDDVHEMVCEAHGDLWFSCVCPACDAVLMDEEFFGVAP